jgi:MFS family permease
VTDDRRDDEALRAMVEDAPELTDRPGWRVGLKRVAVDIRPLRSRHFRNLWIGQSISFFGSNITYVAIPYQTYQLTGSTVLVGLIALAELVPLLTLAVVGGTIADAVDRRRLLLATEIGLVACSALLVVNATLEEPRVWALFVLAAAITSFWALGSPALRSLTPRLVPEDQLASASLLNSAYHSLGAVAGPATGGLLIAGVGLTGTYLIDVATFAASLLAIWRLPPFPPHEQAERAGLRSMVDGFRFVRSQPVILGIFLLDTNAMVFGMPSSLFPALAEHRFGGGASTVGFLYAAPYAGALAATLLSGWVSHVRRQGLAVAIAAALWGLAILLFGFAVSLPLALLLLAFAGAADNVSAAFRSAMVLAATPDEMRGRVSGIELAQVASAPTLGNVEAGIVASLTSLRFSIVSGGAVCIAGTAVILAAFPALLRYDARRARA